MDVKIIKKPLKAEVYRNGKLLKEQELTPEEFKSYMAELSGECIEAVRLANKLFKAKSFTFKGVKI